jgi:hypothetical protein
MIFHGANPFWLEKQSSISSLSHHGPIDNQKPVPIENGLYQSGGEGGI